jgi:hypothetical protein
MRNTNNEVEAVNEVKDVEDSESLDLNTRRVPMFAGEEFRNLSSQGARMQMSGGGLGFSSTSSTSFTSFTSLAFTGVYA